MENQIKSLQEEIANLRDLNERLKNETITKQGEISVVRSNTQKVSFLIYIYLLILKIENNCHDALWNTLNYLINLSLFI